MISPLIFENVFILIVLLALTVSVYAIFFGNKKLRHSPMPAAIGMKTAPLGCLSTTILTLMASCIFYYLPEGPSWAFPLLGVAILIGLIIVYKMTYYFYRKAKEWQAVPPEERSTPPLGKEIKPRLGWGIFLFIVAGLTIPFLSMSVFRIWILPLCLTFFDMNYHAPIEIPLPPSSNSNIRIALIAYPAGMLPHDMGFTLVVDDKRGEEKKFKDFCVNPTGNAKIEIYYIPGKSEMNHDWLQFSQENFSPTYFNLDTLKLENPHPDDIRDTPPQFIGIYTLGKLDTKSKAP